MRLDSLKIGVCVPIFGQELTHARQLVGSLRHQLRPADEIVLSVDGWSPEVESLWKSVSDLPVQIYETTANRGMAQNWNRAIGAATSTHCILVGQDDVLSPMALACHSEMALRYDLTVVGSFRHFIDDDGELLRRRVRANDRSRIFRAGKSYAVPSIEARLLSVRFGNIVGEPSAVLFLRSEWEAIGGYRADLRHAADLDFNLRMARRTERVGMVGWPLFARRLHSNSLTTANVMSGVANRERQEILSAELNSIGSLIGSRSVARAGDGLALYAAVHSPLEWLGSTGVSSLPLRLIRLLAEAGSYSIGQRPLGVRGLEKYAVPLLAGSDLVTARNAT